MQHLHVFGEKNYKPNSKRQRTDAYTDSQRFGPPVSTAGVG